MITRLGLVVLLAVTSSSAQAQELSIYTRVTDVGAVAGQRNAKPPVVSRSLTLFHSGKVYDFIENLGEVTIFDPVHGQFTILHGSRMIATTVDFDEIKHLLKMVDHETREYIERLVNQGDPNSLKAAAALRFQVAPNFEEEYDEATRSLKLTSSQFEYRVKCVGPLQTAATPETSEAYLRYADWTARLNSVLHPRALFPAPRLALNESLRARKLVPVEVELDAVFETRLHLRAEHKIRWKLDTIERGHIHHWEILLKNDRMKHVSFREYQQQFLTAWKQQTRR